ncbi:MAG: menaquinol oxidoreductase [Candidatus Lambdaproteobacteria bacterium RIFOXYD2_FULL_50_16]|uniref:Menaquinol oxidoreductase n=1 Tax=Candidatus Lambdaproteobacteria bacterium RIFOXYD2_FULL_50_16 TaxID=1817772 RepID=A0A1F6G7J7_9PROT|nr:MAG: menaquinol oxidoreductase [Candidatus Lambdaproteobacteria bacterium RIFOXYD2_FULL_50_16]
MIEKALTGDKRYHLWMTALLLVIGNGVFYYLKQLEYGLGITGMSRDISWGVYIAQFTFMVGVAASAVMLVLPYYVHNFKAFGKIVVLGEFLAVAAVSMCLLFIMVDMGHPDRFINVLRYPTPNSMLFWDANVLNVYLVLNLLCGWVVLEAEKLKKAPPKWIKPFIYLSIPWAFSIHTVTAMLYAGLPGRHLWLTAIMAPRFLASAFAAGPALLILLSLLLKRVANFDVGKEAIGKLTTIVTYGILANFFFIGLEFFTAYYSGIPSHQHNLDYLFFVLEGHGNLVPFLWTSVFLGMGGIVGLFWPGLKENEKALGLICGAIFISLWIDKGIGLVIGGFVPNPLGEITEYYITWPEFSITLGIWAIGALILSVLYKIALSVKQAP